MYFIPQLTNLYWLFSRNGNDEPKYVKVIIISSVVNFFLFRLSPMYSTQKGLSINTKHSILMKNPEWSFFSEQVTLIIMQIVVTVNYRHTVTTLG